MGLDISEYKVTDFMAFHDMNTEMRWSAWCASSQREGYKLVPVEASESMLDAGLNCEHEIDNFVVIDEIYKAMIGAVDE